MQKLYSSQAQKFSQTRSAPWKGWETLVQKQIIHTDDKYTVLDIGCGNGRFLKYLTSFTTVDKYLGIDYSKLLLAQAKKIGGKYLQIDIDNTEWGMPGPESESKFNLVVGFGIQHHLSSFENRVYFLKNIYKALEDGGTGIVTYWQFLDYERYKDKITPIDCANNYSMSFAEEKNARFCHYTNMQEIVEAEKESGLKLVDTFRADGRDNTENIYRIYSK